MKTLTASFALLAAGVTAPAFAAQPAPAPQASIPFVNEGGIISWKAEDDSTLYVQSQGSKWYLVKLMAPCTGLPFAMRVGFATGPTDTLDNFSNVIVDGQRCPVQSVTMMSGPPPVKAKK
jgi:hypothetical protein